MEHLSAQILAAAPPGPLMAAGTVVLIALLLLLFPGLYLASREFDDDFGHLTGRPPSRFAGRWHAVAWVFLGTLFIAVFVALVVGMFLD